MRAWSWELLFVWPGFLVAVDDAPLPLSLHNYRFALSYIRASAAFFFVGHPLR